MHRFLIAFIIKRNAYARCSKSDAPLYHQRNVVAYPQDPDTALTALGMDPQSLAKMLTVQFVGSNREALRYEPELSVSVRKLRKAFHWLSLNSWPFMEATKHHSLWETGSLDDALENLLTAYAHSVGGDGAGVPKELLESASQIAAEHAAVHAAGPANCTPSNVDLLTSAGGVDASLGNSQQLDDSMGADLADVDGLQCAAAIDGGIDNLTPVQIWDAVMKKYKVAQKCEEALNKLDKEGSNTAKEDLIRQKTMAIAAAVDGLAKLHHKDTRAKLAEITCKDRAQEPLLKVGLTNEFLNNRDPSFWCWSFMRLFPRGDCAERCEARPSFLPSWRWAKGLLMRADFVLWQCDVEFVASLYNVFLRRDQVSAVEAFYKSSRLSPENQADLQAVTANSLVSYALSSGDVNSVKDLLKRKNLDVPLRNTFRQLQIAQRKVRGSEAEKDNILPKFMALRLWSGCSSLFSL